MRQLHPIQINRRSRLFGNFYRSFAFLPFVVVCELSKLVGVYRVITFIVAIHDSAINNVRPNLTYEFGVLQRRKCGVHKYHKVETRDITVLANSCKFGISGREFLERHVFNTLLPLVLVYTLSEYIRRFSLSLNFHSDSFKQSLWVEFIFPLFHKSFFITEFLARIFTRVFERFGQKVTLVHRDIARFAQYLVIKILPSGKPRRDRFKLFFVRPWVFQRLRDFFGRLRYWGRVYHLQSRVLQKRVIKVYVVFPPFPVISAKNTPVQRE